MAAGRLTDVVLRGPHGDIPGELSVDGRSWTGEDRHAGLRHGLHRTPPPRWTGSAVPVDVTGTLRTVKPSRFVDYTISPRQDGTVGVGMPITLTLDHKLRTDSAKAAVEKTLAVTIADTPVDGGWRWTSDTTVQYRPQEYWPGHVDVVVSASLKGVADLRHAVGRDGPCQHVPHRRRHGVLRRHGHRPDARDEGRRRHPHHPDHHGQGRVRDAFGRQGHHGQGAHPAHGRRHRRHRPERPRVLPARGRVRDARHQQRRVPPRRAVVGRAPGPRQRLATAAPA